MRRSASGVRLASAAVGVALATTACGGPAEVQVPIAAVPRPVVSERGHLCETAGLPSEGGGGPLVSVRRHPTAAEIVRLPGLNPPCTLVRVTADGAEAGRLAAAIDAAPRFPSGTFNCPSDDGSSVEISFVYAGSPTADLAFVTLTGCGSVAAPGRSARALGDVPDVLTAIDPRLGRSR